MDQNQNGNGQPPAPPSFAEQYVEAMLRKIWERRHWAVADLMLRDCPREHLPDVAFIFLHHVVLTDEKFGDGTKGLH